MPAKAFAWATKVQVFHLHTPFLFLLKDERFLSCDAIPRSSKLWLWIVIDTRHLQVSKIGVFKVWENHQTRETSCVSG